MKKILFAFIASFALFTACSSDSDLQEPVGNGETVDVSIVTEIPTIIGTKFASPFALPSINSSKGGVANVDPTEYQLRYILEIEAADGTKTRAIENAQISGSSKVSFSTRLVRGATYKFVAWADFTETATPTANHHYNADNLEAITLAPASVNIVNDDTKDAYFASEDITIGFSSTISMKLKRPFGKVRYVATDYDKFVQSGSVIHSTGIAAKYLTGTEIYTQFDAATGAVSTLTNSFPTISNLLVIDDSNAANEKTLYWDYLFTPTTGGIPLGISLANGTTTITTIGVALGVQAERNKLTTIRQDGFTKPTRIDLEVVDNFDENIFPLAGPASIGGKYYTTIADALTAAQANDVIKVTEGTFDEDFTIKKDVTIEGKGKETILTGRITLAEGSILKDVKSYYSETARTALVIAGNDAELVNVVFDTDKTGKPEAIVTNAGVTGLKVKDCIFNETNTRYWKGLYLNTSAGVEITGCTFNNLNPFSTDLYVSSLVVTGNTFNRKSILGDDKMIHLIAVTPTENSPATWEAGLEATVTQIKTANTWNDTTNNAARRHSVRVNSTYVNGETAWTYIP